MITKGFDFSGVSLVGVLNADNLLNYPDFRASERAFQMMTQVAGRAGRTCDRRGEVVIQTSQPAHPIIGQVRAGDYAGMVRDQLEERRPFGYPPFGRLIEVVLKHRDAALLEAAAWRLAARMREEFGARVYGPHAPVIERISDENLLTVLLKLESGSSASKAKKTLSAIIAEFTSREAPYRTVSVSCNVDPQ
jgi:primosomal protein N' (replication factor Y)